MRNVLKLALLLAAFATTAACTDPDADGADAVAADEPDDLMMDGTLDPDPADLGTAAPIADRFDSPADRVERSGAVGHEEVTPDEVRRIAKARLDWLRRANLRR